MLGDTDSKNACCVLSRSPPFCGCAHGEKVLHSRPTLQNPQLCPPCASCDHLSPHRPTPTLLARASNKMIINTYQVPGTSQDPLPSNGPERDARCQPNRFRWHKKKIRSFYIYIPTPPRQTPLLDCFNKVPTVDTNLVQSLINIMECQLEEAFEAAAATGTGAGAGAGNRKQSISKRKASIAPGGSGEGGAAGGGGGGAGTPLSPKVCIGRTGRNIVRGRREGNWLPLAI